MPKPGILRISEYLAKRAFVCVRFKFGDAIGGGERRADEHRAVVLALAGTRPSLRMIEVAALADALDV